MSNWKGRPCLSCGIPTHSADQLHWHCRPALYGGTWHNGMVQRWTPMETETDPSAPPVGVEIKKRLDSLSPAEAAVLALLAAGHTPQEVAAARVVALGTVRTQIKFIQRRLGVPTVSVAIALAWRAGWITVATRAKDGAA